MKVLTVALLEQVLALEQGSLEGLFLGVFLVVEVAAMGVEMDGEEDKLMAPTPNSLALYLEEDQEAATAEESEDKLLVKISQEQSSLGCLVEGTITVVIVLHNTTIIIMEGTTVGITMDTTMGTTTDTTVVVVDTTVVVVDSIADTTTSNSRGASATTA